MNFCPVVIAITVSGVTSMCSIRSAFNTKGTWLMRVSRTIRVPAFLIGSVRLSLRSVRDSIYRLPQEFQDIGEFFANLAQHRRGIAEEVTLAAGGLLGARFAGAQRGIAGPGFQMLARALDSETLLIKQAFD